MVLLPLVGVERPPVESSLRSLCNHVRITICSGYHKKKMRKMLLNFMNFWSDALKASSSIII